LPYSLATSKGFIHTVGPKDAENLVSCISLATICTFFLAILNHTGDDLDLCNTMRIAQYDTDLGGRGALACEFDDLINAE
jgi:hypothetical protein